MVQTTGSLVCGMQKGLRGGLSLIPNTMVYGNPSGLICVVQSSGLAVDMTNGSLYMGTTEGDMDWIALGSCSF